MTVLEISVNGTSSLHHVAERGVLYVDVISESVDQAAVSEDVKNTSNKIKETFEQLTPKTETGSATPEASVTKFSMGLLQSYSYIPRDKDNRPLPRVFKVQVSFEAIFRDFEKLGLIASNLFATPHVQVNRIEWRLTDSTKEKLESESRKAALVDAIRRAKEYAEIVQREVVVVTITDNGYTTRHRTMQTVEQAAIFSSARSPVGVDLEPEDIEVRGSVEAKFVSE